MGDISDGAVPSSQRPERGSVNIPLGEFPATSTSENVDSTKVAQELIAIFNYTLRKKDYASTADLFLQDKSYWRDHLALTWELRTVKSRDNIRSYLESGKVPLTKVEIDSSAGHRAPQFGPIDFWGDVKGIKFFIKFETRLGRGEGVVALAQDGDEWKIHTFYTLLKELKGHEEPLGKRRTKGVEHGGRPDRKNWKERRDAETDFEDSDPTVLILGS